MCRHLSARRSITCSLGGIWVLWNSARTPTAWAEDRQTSLCSFILFYNLYFWRVRCLLVIKQICVRAWRVEVVVLLGMAA